MNGSYASRSMKIRERAQQSWPALPNTAIGADRAAASRSASMKMTLADLPPSSSVTRLIDSAAPAAIRRPTSVDPVKAILATSGCSTSRCPTTRPGPATTLTTPGRDARLERELGEPQRRQRRQLGGLQHERVAGRQAGRHLPGGDRQREVPRDDQADDAERLAEREVDAAGDRDRVAQQPLGRAGVVAERVDDHAHLAERVADRLAGVARLEDGELVDVLGQRVGQPVQQHRAVGRADGAPGRERGLRGGDGGVGLLEAGRVDRSP